ncbi:MAG: PAS domain S-box protein [Bacillota bacterium]|nr:PAS domain S-box protein [Bacillota bacterium]
MYYAFLSNVLNVLFLSGIIIWISLSLNKKYSPYVLGVMFGLITIFVINGQISVVEGRFYDFRHITMTMAGFIGGPVTAVIAAIISSLYRYHMGGTGSMGGVTSIIVFACFGTFLGKRIKSTQNGKKPFFWLIIGIAMACIFLFIIGFIPPWKGNSVKVLRFVAVPYLIITPLATTIIFNFYFWTYEFFGKASILNTIINSSPINLMIFNNHGPILLSKNLNKQRKSYEFIENPTLLLDHDNLELETTEHLHREITTDDKKHLTTDLSGFQMPNGEYAYVAIINDITDRKKEQEKLKGATERFRKAFQLGPHMMAILRKSDFRYLDVNDRFLDERGFTREEAMGKTPIELGVPDNEFHQIVQTLEEHESVKNYECSLVTKSGSKGSAILSAETIQIDDQECILIAYNDVTEIKRMQKEMATILESMTDCFFAIDKNFNFTYINRAGELAFGRSRDELLNKKITETFNVNGIALLNYHEVMNKKKSMTFEILSEAFGNKWFELSAYPTETGLSCYFRDITDQKVARDEMARLDRLNLVGQMAAGIGHEIRNPMTTVRGYLQLMGIKPEYAKQKSTFELMISELDRANEIITEFLSLAQTKQTELKLQSLNDILTHLYPLLEADTFNQNKRIQYIPGEIPNLELNRKEITQVILNIARNGLEAMQEYGCLTLKTYLQDNQVVLAIKDEGRGIPPETMNKLGIPFYTTKDYGTGLGLATSYKIVESHNAKIKVDSNPSGTTFYIFFSIPSLGEEREGMIA